MQSYTIQQWCELHGLSRSFFYKIAAAGQAPRTFSVGKCRRVSAEANAEWVKSREEEAAQAITREVSGD
jgi:excisionase family DNA binding protein